jgi:hypothetical protein
MWRWWHRRRDTTGSRHAGVRVRWGTRTAQTTKAWPETTNARTARRGFAERGQGLVTQRRRDERGEERLHRHDHGRRGGGQAALGPGLHHESDACGQHCQVVHRNPGLPIRGHGDARTQQAGATPPETPPASNASPTAARQTANRPDRGTSSAKTTRATTGTMTTEAPVSWSRPDPVRHSHRPRASPIRSASARVDRVRMLDGPSRSPDDLVRVPFVTRAVQLTVAAPSKDSPPQIGLACTGDTHHQPTPQ